MKVNFEVGRYTMDWTVFDKVEIETDDFNHFEISCRGGDTDWYLVGHKWNKALQRWEYETFCVWYLRQMIRIYHQIKDKVKRIDIMHFNTKNDSIEQFFKRYNKYLETLATA